MDLEKRIAILEAKCSSQEKEIVYLNSIQQINNNSASKMYLMLQEWIKSTNERITSIEQDLLHVDQQTTHVINDSLRKSAETLVVDPNNNNKLSTDLVYLTTRVEHLENFAVGEHVVDKKLEDIKKLVDDINYCFNDSIKRNNCNYENFHSSEAGIYKKLEILSQSDDNMLSLIKDTKDNIKELFNVIKTHNDALNRHGDSIQNHGQELEAFDNKLKELTMESNSHNTRLASIEDKDITPIVSNKVEPISPNSIPTTVTIPAEQGVYNYYVELAAKITPEKHVHFQDIPTPSTPLNFQANRTINTGLHFNTGIGTLVYSKSKPKRGRPKMFIGHTPSNPIDWTTK